MEICRRLTKPGMVEENKKKIKIPKIHVFLKSSKTKGGGSWIFQGRGTWFLDFLKINFFNVQSTWPDSKITI